MKLDELEDTFEQQKRKERIFEIYFKTIPLVFLLFLYLFILLSVFHI